jgi:putative SOS response-associated peptidase YedK
MPVILKPSEYERWLKDDRVPVDLLRPYDAEAMAVTYVDPGTAVSAKEATLFSCHPAFENIPHFTLV